MSIKFTGERMVPGISSKRIEEDHLARYHFAAKYTRNKSVLDIACGTGYGTRVLLDNGAKSVDGVDNDETTIAFAKETYQAHNISYYIGDICYFEIGIKYDVIVCFETIEHIEDYTRALMNLYNLLQEDGLLIISSPNRRITSPKIYSFKEKPNNKYHSHEFSKTELIKILKDNRYIINKNNVFGQRQQLLFQNNYVNKIYNKIFNPMFRSDYTVKPVVGMTPRYFVIVAEK
ncbi:MAG: class I SAM-dependent methyltransferase [Pseudomonadota bacterium]